MSKQKQHSTSRLKQASNERKQHNKTKGQMRKQWAEKRRFEREIGYQQHT